MSLLTWNSTYSVGVKSLDGQHINLFNMINDLHAAMMSGQAKSVTGGLLTKLVKYTREHFAFEEKMLASTSYPGVTAHRQHHAGLTKQVEEFMARFERGDSTINISLLTFLRDWLTKHIQHEDKQYGPWLNQNGVQ